MLNAKETILKNSNISLKIQSCLDKYSFIPDTETPGEMPK